MPSTSAVTSPLVNGVTQYYGMQIGGSQGAQITALKIYDFSVTTSTFATGSTAFYQARYTVSGLTTNDIPFALIPSTGVWPLALAGLMPATSSAGGLNVLWGSNSTTATAVAITGNMAATLFTMSYATQSSSTTT